MKTSQQESVTKWRKIANEVRGMPIPVVFSAIIVTLVVGTALFGPLFAPHLPRIGELSAKLTPPAWAQGGNPDYFLGTDLLGRDILSRLMYGARTSLVVAFLCVFFSGAIGTAIGLVAGYLGGWIDAVLSRLTDMALSMPLILMAIILVAAFGASLTNVVLVIILFLWPRFARVIRGDVLNAKEQDFVALARVAGCSPLSIMWRHIFPNVLPTLLVIATLQISYVVLIEASLSFLGVGIPPPQPAWGVMVADGRAILAKAWWVALWPGLAIFSLVLSVNLLGDWLRDRLDPKLRQL